MSEAARPELVVLSRRDLEDMLERAVARGRELATEPEWMRAEDVAALLGVKRETVVDYTRREGLPCRYAGKSPVFKRQEVIAWLEARSTSPGSRSTRHGRTIRALKGGR